MNMSGDAAAHDRSALWLPLLRTLTEELPDWCVWKNAESAFTGIGDIDAAAPDTTWPTLEARWVEWAEEMGVGPVVVCRHIPGGLNLIAVPDGFTHLLEMGTKARRVFRGGTMFVFEDLVPLFTMDPRGFRRIRPGAEGLFKLALNGLRWDGRPNEQAMRTKRVRELLAEDLAGAEQAAQIFGSGAHAAISGARAAAAGGWDRRAMLAFQTWALRNALSEPGVLARRVRFRVSGSHQCPVVKTLLEDGRRIPDDRVVWMDEVAQTHEVIT
jgi:hypothetical protein